MRRDGIVLQLCAVHRMLQLFVSTIERHNDASVIGPAVEMFRRNLTSVRLNYLAHL